MESKKKPLKKLRTITRASISGVEGVSAATATREATNGVCTGLLASTIARAALINICRENLLIYQ